MATQIKVPDMGESVVEATVARWMKNEGDAVKAGEAVVELETDKVNLEVAADKDGVLSRIEHPAGDDVKIGDVLAVIEEAGATTTPAPGLPQEGEEAATAPPPNAPTGKREEGFAAEPGGNPPVAEAPKEERATPVAKRVAADQGVDVTSIPGAGPGGRVMRHDVENYLRTQQGTGGKEQGAGSREQGAGGSRPQGAPQSPVATLQSSSDSRGETRVRMSRRRRTIAERLVQAQQTAAMLTTFNEIDMGAVMDLRKRRNEQFEKRNGIKVGFMSFFVKASIGALKAFPPLNAEIQENDIVLKQYYDIGIAVGAEEGLVVPVLRNADQMSFATIEKRIKEFSKKAQEGSLSIEDLRGGTFTITNGGVFGSLLSTPILNPPQVAILGLHKIEERPIALNGQVVIRPMMYVALSYDHRIVDGREAVQFLVKIKELIEDPEVLLLEG